MSKSPVNSFLVAFYAFCNVMIAFFAIYLAYELYFFLGHIPKEYVDRIALPLFFFLLFGFLIQGVRMNFKIFLDDGDLPPMDRKKHFDILYGEGGRYSVFLNITFCICFFFGVILTSLGLNFYSLSSHENWISIVGLLASFVSIHSTFYKQGYGFLKGLGDIVTGFVILYICVSASVNVPLFFIIFAACNGLMLLGSGLYLGTPKRIHSVNSELFR